MVRNLNNEFLTPLTPVFPDYRLSPEGDGPKVGCQTCHKGSFKPLLGASMLPDYPELAGPMGERPALHPPGASPEPRAAAPQPQAAVAASVKGR
jgi:photosynthetic reaction center cytochrome c subunit